MATAKSDDALLLAPPPLFVLSHSNGAPAILELKQEQEQEQEQQPATPDDDDDDEADREVDLSRAGVLLGRVDTPALACYTEHGAVPYLTRDLLLELQSRHPRSFSLLSVDMKTSLPVKEGASDPGTLEERSCNPPGHFMTCLGARDPLDGVTANCTPAQLSVDTLYGRRSLTPAGHAALVARLRPTLATAVMDEAPASASRTRQQKAVERSLAWLDHLLRATAASSKEAEHPAAIVEGGDAPKENNSVHHHQPAQVLKGHQQHDGPQEQGLKVVRGQEGRAPVPYVLGGVVGGTDLALRRQSARETAKRVSAAGGGISIGGLGLGESTRERKSVLRAVAVELPEPLLRVCVGLSTPLEVLDAMLAGGVDLINSPFSFQLTLLGHALAFPVEMAPAENEESEQEGPEPKRRRLEDETGSKPARIVSGSTSGGGPEEGQEGSSAIVNLWDRRWQQDARPLVAGCLCLACRRHSRAYLHHLLLAHEMAGEVLLHAHNLEHFLRFVEEARRHVLAGTLPQYREHIARALLTDSFGC